MKANFLTLISICFFMNACTNAVEKTARQIQWLGQASVRIQYQGKIIYIDPYQIEQNDLADVILISHSHSDHFSPQDINKLRKESTILVCPASMEDTAKTLNIPFLLVKPNEGVPIDWLQIETTPAYNVVKTNFHPSGNLWLGYIITINGVRIYHTGDTEIIPEMKNIRADVILLPLGQTYTMNRVEDAVQCALDVKAQIAIPIHYGLYEGTMEDALQFKKLLDGKIEVIIKESIKKF